jgi:hypothetical protein
VTETPWAGRRIEYDDLDSLPPAPRNPKGHNKTAIRASIDRFGFVTPAVVDERTGRLVVGHGRSEVLKDMRAAGQVPPDGVRLSDDGRWLVPVVYGWSSRSDVEAEAYLIADNQNTIAGGWDNDGLVPMLRDIDSFDHTLLDVTGFDDDALATLLAEPEVDPHDDSYNGGAGDDGNMLGLAGATVSDPEYKVERGDVWRMGKRLTLVVASPHTEWDEWVGFLEGDMLLLPYPSPMAALADGAKDRDVLFVQPNKWLAGWLLTKWARVTGGTPSKVDPE